VTGPKLIRDLVPQRAAERGDQLTTRVAEPAEMPGLLAAKLAEEVREYLDSGDPAELADVAEVVVALAAVHGIDLEAARMRKLADRGGFARRLVWDGAP
jgi:predicted house-cleaning noncanonical NTP pyrophosphatase (MazG superfamily)